MNPTFSSPVLQERVTYTWEDLQKAAAGVFTDTLTNEKARLESLAQKDSAAGYAARRARCPRDANRSAADTGF